VTFQGKEAASKPVAGDGTLLAAAVKNGGNGTGVGTGCSGHGSGSTGSSDHGDSASHRTVLTASHTKKTIGATPSPGRDVSKVKLVAELNSRLAKLTDAAASDALVQPSATTAKTNGSERRPVSSQQFVSRAQSEPKVNSRSGEKEAAATKQRNATSATGTDTSLANCNNKNSSLTQSTRVFTCLSYMLIAFKFAENRPSLWPDYFAFKTVSMVICSYKCLLYDSIVHLLDLCVCGYLSSTQHNVTVSVFSH